MIHVLYHSDSDGRFAGYAAWSYLLNHQVDVEKDVRFYEVQYNQPFPFAISDLKSGDKVYILDFSYDRVTLDIIYGIVGVGNLVVLDHHKTAKEALVGAPYAEFDMEKSGALLAWLHFFPNDVTPPYPCTLVNDRDLWQWKYEDTAAFEAWLRFDHVGSNWAKWERLCVDQHHLTECINFGKAIVKNNQAIIDSFKNNPSNTRLGILTEVDYHPSVHYVVYCGMGILTSELAQAMYNKFDVHMTIEWRIRDDQVVFSLRSPRPEIFSVGEFAKRHDGGGHPAAAGFTLPLKEGLDYVLTLMTNTA